MTWSLIQVARGERALEVEFRFGGCDQNAVGHVSEHPHGIAVTVTIESRQGGEIACPAIAGVGRLKVDLGAPLAGRRLLGTWSPSGPEAPGGRAMPRLIGLAPGDARRMADRIGVARVRVSHGHRGLPRVASQTPAPGAPVASDAAVVLRVDAP